jgi:hypothetical protein
MVTTIVRSATSLTLTGANVAHTGSGCRLESTDRAVLARTRSGGSPSSFTHVAGSVFRLTAGCHIVCAALGRARSAWTGQSVSSRSIERAGSWPSISSHSGTSPTSNGRG